MTVKPPTASAKLFDLHEFIDADKDHRMSAFPTSPRLDPLIPEMLVYRMALW